MKNVHSLPALILAILFVLPLGLHAAEIFRVQAAILEGSAPVAEPQFIVADGETAAMETDACTFAVRPRRLADGSIRVGTRFRRGGDEALELTPQFVVCEDQPAALTVPLDDDGTELTVRLTVSAQRP